MTINILKLNWNDIKIDQHAGHKNVNETNDEKKLTNIKWYGNYKQEYKAPKMKFEV